MYYALLVIAEEPEKANATMNAKAKKVTKDVSSESDEFSEQEDEESESEVEHFQIFVVDFNGKIHTINDVVGNDIVMEIKHTVKWKTGVRKFRLTLGGKDLDDDKTMTYYKIEKSTTLHMLARLKGGVQKGHVGIPVTMKSRTERGGWIYSVERDEAAEAATKADAEAGTAAHPNDKKAAKAYARQLTKARNKAEKAEKAEKVEKTKAKTDADSSDDEEQSDIRLQG